MCLIIYKEKNVPIDEAVLRSSWQQNPDGAGYSVKFKGGEWITKKGFMKYEDFFTSYAADNGMKKKTEAVVHMRIATKGKVNKENCHPFYTKDKSFIFYQNGTVPGFGSTQKTCKKTKKKTGKSLSDTKDVFDSLLTQVEAPIRDKILESYTDHCRFLTLEDGVVNIYGDWDEYKGLMMSNDRIIPMSAYSYTGYGSYGNSGYGSGMCSNALFFNEHGQEVDDPYERLDRGLVVLDMWGEELGKEDVDWELGVEYSSQADDEEMNELDVEELSTFPVDVDASWDEHDMLVPIEAEAPFDEEYLTCM